jgi:hypothetical protein
VTAHYELSPPFWAPVRQAWFGDRYAWTFERRGASHASVCDDRGRPATALPSITATMAAGAQIGNYETEARIEPFVFHREPQGHWSHRVVVAGESVPLASIGCNLDVDRVHAGTPIAKI